MPPPHPLAPVLLVKCFAVLHNKSHSTAWLAGFTYRHHTHVGYRMSNRQNVPTAGKTEGLRAVISCQTEFCDLSKRDTQDSSPDLQDE